MTILPDPNSKAGIASTAIVGGAGLTAPAWSTFAGQIEMYLSLGVQIASFLYITTMIILNYPKVKKVFIKGFGKDENTPDG